MVRGHGLRSSSPATGVIWALRAKVQKSPKMGSRTLSATGVEKVEKETRKSPKSPKIVSCGLFLDFFGTRGLSAPEPIFGLFLDFGPEGPK